MPFDECAGGGGGSGPHDSEGLKEVAAASLLQLSINCEANDLCEFHAGILMQAMMMDGLCATFDKHPDDRGAQQMLEDQLDLINRALTKLHTVINKHKTPLN